MAASFFLRLSIGISYIKQDILAAKTRSKRGRNMIQFVTGYVNNNFV
jgi:hypothetical protein